jgi:hypothetical protein
MDEVLATSLDGSKRGIQWSLRQNEHLVNTRQSDMQAKLNNLHRNTGHVALQVGEEKTKSMTVGTDKAVFKLKSTTIECVDSFTYLGSII